MTLTVNNQTIDFTFNEGGAMTATFANGNTFTWHGWRRKPTEEETPMAIHDSLCAACEGSRQRHYRTWRNLWCTGNKRRDMAEYRRSRRAAALWRKACRNITPEQIMNKLNETYGDF